MRLVTLWEMCVQQLLLHGHMFAQGLVELSFTAYLVAMHAVAFLVRLELIFFSIIASQAFPVCPSESVHEVKLIVNCLFRLQLHELLIQQNISFVVNLISSSMGIRDWPASV